ncbi:MAG: carbohydrate porin, partial [Nodosilinea sp.]
GQPLVRTVTGNPAINTTSLLWLNFDTSFSGADRLKLQLVTGAGSSPANLYGSAGLFNTFGASFLNQGGVPAGEDFSLFVRELSYAFPVGDNITIDIGPRINWYAYFDNNRYTFFLTGASSFNSSGGTQVNAVDRGTGAIAVWDVADWLDIRVGYLAENTEFIGGPKAPSDPAVGLFGGTSTITGQIGIRPFDNFNLRLLYTRSNLMPNRAGQIGGTFGEPIYGFADDGVGGPLTNAPADTFLVNFDWGLLSWLGLFGRYSYGSVDLTSAVSGAGIGSVDAQSFQVGLAFPDLFKEGAQATISYLVPFSVVSGEQFLASGYGNGGRQQELEIAYRYPINRNIALVPSVYWIQQANNFSSNPDIFIFNMLAQLSF